MNIYSLQKRETSLKESIAPICMKNIRPLCFQSLALALSLLCT